MAQMVKNLPAMWETQVQSLCQSLGWEDPLRRKWPLTLVVLPGKFHGQRSPTGYSPRGRKKSDTTELLNQLSEGYGCSILENTKGLKNKTNSNSKIIQ